MKNIFLALFSFLMAGCQPEKTGHVEVMGLWCNELEHCIYFKQDSCLLDEMWFYEYSIKEDTICLPKRNYVVDAKGNNLKLKRTDKSHFLEYSKRAAINQKSISEISYSHLSDFSDFNVQINENGEFVMKVLFHNSLESGFYFGKLSGNYMDFLLELIANMKIEISSELRPEIISDLQEWALILDEKGVGKYYLYHNYLGISKNHKYFANFMRHLPLVVEKFGTFENENEIYFEVEKFRKREFERNLNI